MEELGTSKLKKTNSILILIIFILVLAIGALSYYTFFIYEKEEVVVEEDKKLTASQVSEVLFNFEYEKLFSKKQNREKKIKS